MCNSDQVFSWMRTILSLIRLFPWKQSDLGLVCNIGYLRTDERADDKNSKIVIGRKMVKPIGRIAQVKH